MVETWYANVAAGLACGPGTRRTLSQTIGGAAQVQTLDATGSTWNRTEERTISAGSWQVHFDAAVTSGGGPANRVQVLVERRSAACSVLQTIVDQAMDVAKGATAVYSTDVVNPGVVTFGPGDRLLVTFIKTQGNQTVQLRYDWTVGSTADTRIVLPDAAVPAAPSGTATGGIGRAGSATGQRLSSGAASGTVGWAGNATGDAPSMAPNTGSASGAASWAGSAAGASGVPTGPDVTVTFPDEVTIWAGTAGHPYTTTSGAGSTFDLNDTTDFILGDRSIKITTNGTGQNTQVNDTGGTPIDMTGRIPRIWVKVDQNSIFNSGQFWLGSGAGFADSYRWQLKDADPTPYYSDREWVAMTLPWSKAVAQGTPNRAALTNVQIQVFDTNAGQPLTVHWGGFSTIPDTTTRFPNGVVSFTFDDGYASHSAEAATYLQSKGFRGTAFIISDVIGSGDRMSLAQMTGLQDVYGWEVALHSDTAADHNVVGGFTALTTAQRQANVAANRTFLTSNGITNPQSFAYPQGLFDPYVVTDLADLVESARTSKGTQRETVPPGSRMKMYSRAVNFTALLADITVLIDQVKTHREWLILTFHDIVASGASGTSINQPVFRSIVDYAETAGVAVLPVGEVMSAPPNTGAATGSMTWAGTALGSTTHSGTVSGSTAWAASVVGERASVGSADGSIAWAGSATGQRASKGAASAAVAWAGSAAGSTPSVGVNQGTATGSVAYAGAASGTAPVVGAANGSASGTLTWAGTATGQRTSSGATVGALGWAASATGTAPTVGVNSGSAAGTWAYVGAATGERTSAGAAAGGLTLLGSAMGSRASAGIATGELAWTGLAIGPHGLAETPPERTLFVDDEARVDAPVEGVVLDVDAEPRTHIVPAEIREVTA